MHAGSTHLPPIRITISKGDQSVVIRISDQGMPRPPRTCPPLAASVRCNAFSLISCECHRIGPSADRSEHNLTVHPFSGGGIEQSSLDGIFDYTYTTADTPQEMKFTYAYFRRYECNVDHPA
jgi:hypothetical protein